MENSIERNRRSGSGGATWLASPAFLFVTALLIGPLLMILRFSFGVATNSGISVSGFSLRSYLVVLTDSYFRLALINTFALSIIVTIVALIISMPVAYYLSRIRSNSRNTVTVLLLFPFLSGTVVTSLGWVTILKTRGVLSWFINAVTAGDSNIEIMYSRAAIVLVLSILLAPIMILCLLSGFDGVGKEQELAARTLGASKWNAFWTVVAPQTIPGVIAGTTLTFILSVNSYAVPALIGGQHVPMAPIAIYDAMTRTRDWPVGSALSIYLVLGTIIVSVLYAALMKRGLDSWRTA